MTILRMDNVLLVVDDLDAVKAFFVDLGLTVEGEATVEGPDVGRLIGLGDVRATLVMLRTPDGHGGIELDKFHTPGAVRLGPVDAPVNALGWRRVMFAVTGIDDVLARVLRRGAALIGEMTYGDAFRLAYVRGPEGIIVGLAEELRGPAAAAAPKRARRKPAPRRAKSAPRRPAPKSGKRASHGRRR